MRLTKNVDWGNTFGYYITFIALGLETAALGPTLPSLAEHTHTQLSGVSFLFTASAFGYLLGSYQGGRLYDRMPGNPVMAGALLLVALTLVLVPLIPLLWLLAIAVLLLGAAGGVLDVGGNTLLVWVHGRKVGPFMNGLHFFFGLGAFLTPIVVALSFSASGDVTWAYWALALFMLPVAIWLLRVASPEALAKKANSDSGDQEAAAAHIVDGVLVLLLGALLFLYVGAEAGFGGWIFSYALALDLGSPTTSAYLTSVFWGALTVGRLLGIPIAMRLRPRTILLVDLIGCLLSVGALLVWPGSWAATWLGAIGLGLSMASIFPTIISVAERRMTVTGRITGLFLMGSSLGSMLLPWLIGQFFETVGPGMTMVILLIDLVVALGVYALVMIYSARRLSLPEGLAYNRDEG